MRNSIFCKAVPAIVLYSTLLTIFFITCKSSLAQNTLSENGQMHIVSDKMVAKQDSQMVEFSGNVKVTRPDFILNADNIKLFLNSNDNAKDTQSRVKKIVCEGNVHYTARKEEAFADKAVYTAKDQVLILTGTSPKIKIGADYISGKKITYFRKQGKAIVEGSAEKRVEALYNPEEKNTN
ncbi:MAG: hypothetical protein GY729_16270 [Desulfobacteraceae bacterium]|nr:hypothetical protein [Desulfobacteraceae bacterium]